MNIRQAGQQFRFPKSTVAYWVQRSYGERLDRVDLANRKPGRASNRTAFDVDRRIAQLRIDLRESALGEYGAGAIRTALQAEMARVPSEASVNRVLARLGLQDGVRRIRRPAPPKGWYLPSVIAGQTEVDCFDFITELRIAGGPLIDVLTAKSLHGSLTDAWVIPRSTEGTIPLLLARWQRDGLPAYAQFDNDNVFQGPHQHAHAVGRVGRMCLQLGVAPVFVPALEHGMRNSASTPCGRPRFGSGTAWPV